MRGKARLNSASARVHLSLSNNIKRFCVTSYSDILTLIDKRDGVLIKGLKNQLKEQSATYDIERSSTATENSYNGDYIAIG
jgi:hypothetical protein